MRCCFSGTFILLRDFRYVYWKQVLKWLIRNSLTDLSWHFRICHQTWHFHANNVLMFSYDSSLNPMFMTGRVALAACMWWYVGVVGLALPPSCSIPCLITFSLCWKLLGWKGELLITCWRSRNKRSRLRRYNKRGHADLLPLKKA